MERARTKREYSVHYSTDFLGDILHNHVENKFNTEEHINWIIGASAIIFGLSIPELMREFSWGLAVICFASVVSFLIGLYSLEPVNVFKKKQKQAEAQDVMFYKSFKELSAKEYATKLKSLTNLDKIKEQYAIDIKNLVEFHLIPKNRYLKWMTRILLIGTITGILLLTWQFFL